MAALPDRHRFLHHRPNVLVLSSVRDREDDHQEGHSDQTVFHSLYGTHPSHPHHFITFRLLGPQQGWSTASKIALITFTLNSLPMVWFPSRPKWYWLVLCSSGCICLCGICRSRINHGVIFLHHQGQFRPVVWRANPNARGQNLGGANKRSCNQWDSEQAGLWRWYLYLGVCLCSIWNHLRSSWLRENRRYLRANRWHLFMDYWIKIFLENSERSTSTQTGSQMLFIKSKCQNTLWYLRKKRSLLTACHQQRYLFANGAPSLHCRLMFEGNSLLPFFLAARFALCRWTRWCPLLVWLRLPSSLDLRRRESNNRRIRGSGRDNQFRCRRLCWCSPRKIYVGIRICDWSGPPKLMTRLAKVEHK